MKREKEEVKKSKVEESKERNRIRQSKEGIGYRVYY